MEENHQDYIEDIRQQIDQLYNRVVKPDKEQPDGI